MACEFSSLGLSEWLVKQISAVGFKKPTPIQEHCIPPILEGCAKTGSGKTAAFALPIIHKLAEDPYGVFSLILTPTRELAYQIADQFRVFGKQIGLKDAVIIGGIDMMKQGLLLSRKPHIVIATPGRLADHLRNTETVSFKKIKFLVMDEADRLLDPSFEEDLETIFSALPSKRQTLLFSATLTDSLSRLHELALSKPFYWEERAEKATVDELEQKYLLMPAKVKDCYLVHLLEDLHEEKTKMMIIFTNTCRNCHVYAMLLEKLELPCVALHSLMSQGRRFASLAKFKSGRVRILVATDIASRGLDIPTVQVVINSNVPADPKDYIHRVGRTARAGRDGLSITLMTQFDIDRIKNIEGHINCTMSEYTLNEDDVLQQLDRVTITKREVEMKLRQTAFGERRKINKQKKKILKEMVKLKKKRGKSKMI